MTAGKYSRDELARLETVLRGIAGAAEAADAGILDETDPTDLRHAADFLAETVGVLDRQKRNAQRRAAKKAIEAKKRRGRSR